jgi:uncharacterized membrane protein YccC
MPTKTNAKPARGNILQPVANRNPAATMNREKMPSNRKRGKAATHQNRQNANPIRGLLGEAADAFRRFRSYLATMRHDLLRVSLQTAASVSATYAIVIGFNLPHMTWAVIASLYTIGGSADDSLSKALARVAGASLGVAFGLFASGLLDGPTVLVIVAAAMLANATATLFPSMHYAAVTAAIVALDPVPDLSGALDRAVAIFIGAGTAVAAGIVVLPLSARQRVVSALQRALWNCEELFTLITDALQDDDRGSRDAVHAAFLQNLETARFQSGAAMFGGRKLDLQAATITVESLWHALVILDRAVSDERPDIPTELLPSIQNGIREVQNAACEEIRRISRAFSVGAAPSKRELDEVINRVRHRFARSVEHESGASRRAVDALLFALWDVGLRMRQVSERFDPQSPTLQSR